MSDDLPAVKPKTKHGVLQPVFDRNGQQIGIKFYPTPNMRIWVQERVKPEHKGKSDEEVARSMGANESYVKYWANRYGEHFLDWYEIELERAISPIKALLHAVGIEKALEGDFQYWKELSRTWGVISAEQVEQKISVSRAADQYDNLTEEQLIERQKKLIRQAQSLEHERTDDVAGESSVGGQGSSSNGSGDVQEGLLANIDAMVRN